MKVPILRVTTTALSGLRIAFLFARRFVVAVFGVLLPLVCFRMAIHYHWLLGILLIGIMGVVISRGIDNYQKGRLDTWHGIFTLGSLLSITTSIFGFLSFVLNMFGFAHYKGFDSKAISDAPQVLLAFIGFYIWQLCELIPAVRINQTFESLNKPPLEHFGFWAGALVIGFRVVMVFIVLDVFRKWWSTRKSKTPTHVPEPIERWVITGSMIAAANPAGKAEGDAR